MEDSIKNIITALLADDDSALKELFRAQVEDAVDRFVMTQVATYNDQNLSRIRRTRTGITGCKDTFDSMF
ncbi:hypothetical protein [Limosilactobacillus allomucosae]|uniref:hypothetical protein n=1 Tax=Limosilactobacillus allomucosae TaxID=3142938 RepID=UPI003264DFCB